MRPATTIILLLFFTFASEPSSAVAAQPFEQLTSQLSSSVSGKILQGIVVITVLSVAPAILLTVTCFTRLIVALSFLRAGLGLQSTPANMILITLALFMTSFVMAPTFDRAWQNGVSPLLESKITHSDAIDAVVQPFREFMLSQVREKDIMLFHSLSAGETTKTSNQPRSDQNVSMRILLPAFLISELRRGFEIGLLIILPFLIIDLIVATLVMSMGMMMMPPSVIALPIKILFFVLIDGWNILVGALLRSFG